mgnify:FL=1
MTSMTSLKRIKYKKVIVHWVDISSNPEWVQDIDSEDYCKTCQSIGWLKTKNNKSVKIFSSFNLKDDGNINDYGDIVVFPRSVVKKIEVLK